MRRILALLTVLAASFLLPACSSISFDNNFNLLAAGAHGVLLSSADGDNWSYRGKSGIEFKQIAAVLTDTPDGMAVSRAITDSVIVATSYHSVYASLDGGKTWLLRYTVNGVDGGINKMIVADGVFLIAGGGSGFILRSEDGLNWTKVVTSNETAFARFNSIAYGNGLIVAVGSGDRIVTSADLGLNWNYISAGSGQKSFYGIAYGNGVFVGVGVGNDGFHSRWATSTDGATWNNETVSDTWMDFYDVAFGNGVFVAVGYKIIATSTNGINWTSRWIGNAEFYGVTYYNGRFVTVGRTTQYEGSAMMFSEDDGVNWLDVDLTTNDVLNDVSVVDTVAAGV